MTLDGQRIVVIGGSSGMGLATARRSGARRRRGHHRLKPTGTGRRGAGRTAGWLCGHALDVRDETQVAALFERVGEFDHLAFTAGDAFMPRPLADLGLSDAHAILDVRFWGAVAVIKHAAPRIRPGGSIGLTTGTVGQRPVPGAALAAAGAGATEGLVRGLAVELAPDPCQRGQGRRFSHAALGRRPRGPARGAFCPLGPAHLDRNGRRAGANSRRTPLPHAEPVRHRNGANRRRRSATRRELTPVRPDEQAACCRSSGVRILEPEYEPGSLGFS